MFEMPPLQHYIDDFGDSVDIRIMYHKTYLIHSRDDLERLRDEAYPDNPTGKEYHDIMTRRLQARAAIEQLEAQSNNKEGSA